jgi:Sulfotransferase family
MAGQRAPVLILSPPRSFSSVVCAMLGQHPQLAAFPELNLFVADTVHGIFEYVEASGAARLLDGTVRALAELRTGIQSEEATREQRRWLEARADWPVKRLYDHLLDLVHPRVGVDKSPLTAISPSFLGRAYALYPAARFIHLTRHPVTAIGSLRRLFPAESSGVSETRSVTRATWAWVLTHRTILDFVVPLPPEQTFRARGEDLVSRPNEFLPRLATWLGVSPATRAIEAMKQPERSSYAREGPPGAPGGNDPGFLHEPQLRPAQLSSTIDVPAEWGLEPGVVTAVREVALALGYG